MHEVHAVLDFIKSNWDTSPALVRWFIGTVVVHKVVPNWIEDWMSGLLKRPVYRLTRRLIIHKPRHAYLARHERHKILKAGHNARALKCLEGDCINLGTAPVVPRRPRLTGLRFEA